MIEDEIIKLPRLFIDQELNKNSPVHLTPAHAHYLRNVLRRSEGDKVRLFNGHDGEWLATLETIGKKNAVVNLQSLIRPQTKNVRHVHLLFAPIKKTRLNWLIEKATELGCTHLHPVLTQNTEVRKLKTERMEAQIIEAAEQCERMDVPVLENIQSLDELYQNWAKNIPVYACFERDESAPFLGDLLRSNKTDDIAILIGPEGGFTKEELEKLEDHNFIEAVSLGTQILRSETAACMALSLTVSP